MTLATILARLGQVVGAALMLLIMLDVFLTVLYARIGTGIISNRVADLTWRAFPSCSRPFHRRRDAVLSFCGPVILVMLVVVWIAGLICGAALIIQPLLGTLLVDEHGQTPTDFLTAMYVAGDSMTTVGALGFSIRSSAFRVFYMSLSVIGLSIITLVITYFLELYNALQARNTFAIKVFLATAETGDAAELLAGIGPQGDFRTGYTHLAEMAAEMTNFKEAHDLHSVLLYFRFENRSYSVLRLMVCVLDALALIKTALDDERYRWLKDSAAVAQLWRGSMSLLTSLADVFLPGGRPVSPQTFDDAEESRWRQCYRAALERLRSAGIQTIADEDAGVSEYLNIRSEWQPFITAFSQFMAQPMNEVDPATRVRGYCFTAWL